MQLDTFITETLKSIIKGVKDAQDFALENEARINPHVGKWDHDKTQTIYFGNEEGARAVSTIDFDIALTTSNQQEADGQAKINVFSFKMGGDISDKATNESVSRIKFSINVALPNVKP